MIIVMVICDMQMIIIIIKISNGVAQYHIPLPIRNTQRSNSDHPRDQPGKYLYYAGTFWLYLHSHCRLRNMTLVCVLCAYNGDLTMALV